MSAKLKFNEIEPTITRVREFVRTVTDSYHLIREEEIEGSLLQFWSLEGCLVIFQLFPDGGFNYCMSSKKNRLDDSRIELREYLSA